MKKLQIRLPIFKQVSMTCEDERSRLCYIMKTFKYISVVKIAKVTIISTINDIKIWVGGKQNPPLQDIFAEYV